MYRQPWDLAQDRKSAGYDHKDKSNHSLNCQKSRFSARLRKLFQRLRDKDHISNLSLLKLCSWVDDVKISVGIENGRVMIINTRVIDPLTAKYAHMGMFTQ